MPVTRTPIGEYIAILRSYLTARQKRAITLLVESKCRSDGMLSPMEYSEILQSCLTPLQKAGVYERLETVFSERGWLARRAA